MARKGTGRGAFIGRADEWSAIRGALDGALDRRGAVLLVSGEAGIGKSRLVEEACAEAARLGFRVLRGRAWESGGAPALWPWTQALSELVSGERALVAGLDDGSRGALGAIVPAIGGDAPGPGSDEARFALLVAVDSLLAAASERTPLLLCLDDLHAADLASLRLLQFVARAVAGRRLVLIGAYRELEVRADRERSQALARVALEATALRLGPLDAADTGALASLHGAELAVDEAAALHRATRGNPLFIGELARLRAVDRAGEAVAALPSGVREVIRQRLALVSPSTQAALRAGSVVGREFTSALLSALAREGDGIDVEAALAEATAMEIVEPAGPGRYRFTHILVREVLHRDLPGTERVALHRRAGEALERLHAGDPEPPSSAIAHHYLQAATEIGFAPAVRHAIAAAGLDQDHLAHDEATSRLRELVAALDAAHVFGPLRGEALLALGHAELLAGDQAATRRSFSAALALARRLDDASLLARAALGLGAELTEGVVDPELVACLREALERLPATEASLRARVMARLAAALQPAADPGPPIRLALDAIELARSLGDASTLLAVIHAGMAALMDYVAPSRRLPLNREADALATVAGDRLRALRARARLAIDHLEAGEVAAAEIALARYDELAAIVGQPRFAWRSRGLHAMRALFEGRFADADLLIAEAAAFAGAARDPAAVLPLALQRMALAIQRESALDLAAHGPPLLELSRGLAGELGWFHLFTAHGWARLGDRERTRVHLVQVDIAGSIGADPIVPAMIASAIDRIGDPTWAPRLAEVLAPVGHLNMSWGLAGMACEGPLAFSLGQVAELMGERADAVRHFADAAERAERQGARPALARALFRLGRLLAAQERSAARGHLERARALAAELGLAVTLAEIESTLGANPGAPGDAIARVTLERRGAVWSVRFADRDHELADRRGLHYLAALVAEPAREIHVLDLVGGGRGQADGGDAGELVDRQARDAYRRRLAELRAELDEADEAADLGRSARLRAELEALTRELTRAVGLGGRTRRSGTATERARIAVQRRIRDAIDRLAEVDPGLGFHLRASVRTGVHCVYLPVAVGPPSGRSG